MNPDPTSLDRLHDVIAPPPAPWWPPAPGWYWLLGLVALAALCGLIAALIRRQRNRYRREALELCGEIAAELGDGVRREDALAALAVLLKRVALTAGPRAEVASLTGAAWVQYLQRTGGAALAPEAALRLERAAYGIVEPMSDRDAAAAVAVVERWIRKHRAPAQKDAPC
jgi:hypothetical protein